MTCSTAERQEGAVLVSRQRLRHGRCHDMPLLPLLTCNLNFFHNLVGGVVDIDGHVDGLSMVVDLRWEEARLHDLTAWTLSLGTQRVAQVGGWPPTLTSLSREASRCRGLSDIMNWRVVSDLGAGPVFMGANWILRMMRRTEFLRGEKQSPTPSPSRDMLTWPLRGTLHCLWGTSQCHRPKDMACSLLVGCGGLRPGDHCPSHRQSP